MFDARHAVEPEEERIGEGDSMNDPSIYPWRTHLATMPPEARERWGRRANELESEGVRFPESERRAFEEIFGEAT